MAGTGHIFPDITPSQRSFTPGVFPKREFQGLNGAVTEIQFGARPVDSKLEMTFQNISDDQAWDIFNNYLLVNGGSDPNTGERDFVLFNPADTAPALKGVRNESLMAAMAQRGEENSKLRYRYTEPPSITSSFPGRSTVQVKLRGYLEGASTQ